MRRRVPRCSPTKRLVARILDATVAAVDVPVTLKIRTGPGPAMRNAVTIARIAAASGVAALTVHGRTRACAFVGAVDYDTIAAVKRAVAMPVIANGDIDTPERALHVLRHTGADAVMIGRAAQGRPWIFREIAHFLATGMHLPPPTVAEVRALILEHLGDHYAFYGEHVGVRIARKHLHWYTARLPGGPRISPCRQCRGNHRHAGCLRGGLFRSPGRSVAAPGRTGRATRRSGEFTNDP